MQARFDPYLKLTTHLTICLASVAVGTVAALTAATYGGGSMIYDAVLAATSAATDKALEGIHGNLRQVSAPITLFFQKAKGLLRPRRAVGKDS